MKWYTAQNNNVIKYYDYVNEQKKINKLKWSDKLLDCIEQQTFLKMVHSGIMSFLRISHVERTIANRISRVWLWNGKVKAEKKKKKQGNEFLYS